MKIEQLQPGMTVFSVTRQLMGNTRIKTVAVHEVHVVAVDAAVGLVEARWNGNAARRFSSRVWSKWKAQRPALVGSALGPKRLATRAEIAAQAKEGVN